MAVSAFLAVSALDGCISLFSCISSVRPYQPGGCIGQEMGAEPDSWIQKKKASTDLELRVQHLEEENRTLDDAKTAAVASGAVSALDGCISLFSCISFGWLYQPL